MNKLNYKIVGRRPTFFPEIEAVDVEWIHDDGPITDYEMIPVTHPPNIVYERRPSGQREFIVDQLNVPNGTSDIEIFAMCEKKRAGLAKALGISP